MIIDLKVSRSLPLLASIMVVVGIFAAKGLLGNFGMGSCKESAPHLTRLEKPTPKKMESLAVDIVDLFNVFKSRKGSAPVEQPDQDDYLKNLEQTEQRLETVMKVLQSQIEINREMSSALQKSDRIRENLSEKDKRSEAEISSLQNTLFYWKVGCGFLGLVFFASVIIMQNEELEVRRRLNLQR